MAKNNRKRPVAAPTPMDMARDELFQQIMQCGVIGALPEHQAEWFTDTMVVFADRYPELSEADLAGLRTMGERFAQPAKRQTGNEAAVSAA